jgi:hypothetical protein
VREQRLVSGEHGAVPTADLDGQLIAEAGIGELYECRVSRSMRDRLLYATESGDVIMSNSSASRTS